MITVLVAGAGGEASEENQRGSIGMKTEMRTTKATKLSKFQRVLWVARPSSRRLFLSDSEQLVLNAWKDVTSLRAASSCRCWQEISAPHEVSRWDTELSCIRTRHFMPGFYESSLWDGKDAWT